MDNEAKSLYEIFQRSSYSELKGLFESSKTKDEQDFYMALSNMVLQREQLKVCELSKIEEAVIENVKR